ncbi:hypothetical protein [Paenibacillus sinopodophylli]|uniref:hypothetical protein n=1 Tax=Paenibacillus sinopodophylli TaxID=1837342 RepID=UPI00110CCBD4|nr:hypothetical protein [Paenibacillus sinopodophylli]
MNHSFIIEPQTYTLFENDAEQIEKCKEWGLLSEKAAKTKIFYYKGYGNQLACNIIGFVDKLTAVIAFENDQMHCIHPSYLKEMQAANYGMKSTIAAEEAVISETTSTELVEEATNSLDEAEPALEASTATLEPTVQEEPKPKPTAKEKTKKEKTPKLQLPEEKVKMTATVKAFTTVPNNFSDTEDEVIIYEAVSIEEPALAVEDAWSSHSATLKKFELEIGDIVHFEGKIVAKKLSKHPIPYKINNPAKIQKEKRE